MAKDFRNLEIWQEAYKLTLEVYKLTAKFPKEEKFSLTDQMRRASNSAPANIAEACGRYHNKDKIQLLVVARGSILEMRSHLSVALGLRYIIEREFEEVDKRYEILLKRLNSFINHVKGNQKSITNPIN